MKTALAANNDAPSSPKITLLLFLFFLLLCRPCQSHNSHRPKGVVSSSSSSFAPPPSSRSRLLPPPARSSRRRSNSTAAIVGGRRRLGAHDDAVVVVVASRNNRMTAYASAVANPSSSSSEDDAVGTTGDVGRTTTATAAAMIPPSSSSSSYSSSSSSSGTHFPNWRVVDPRRGEDDRDDGRAIRSPFCHSPSPSSTDGGRDDDDYDGRAAASQSHAAAPWSESAYRSSLDLHDKIIAGMGMTNPPTTTATNGEEEDGIASLARRALHDIGSAYRLHGPYCTIGSYNGGKDACVALHLMRAAHADHCRTEMLRRRRGRAADPGAGGDGDRDGDGEFVVPRPRVIYFQHADEFPEVLSLLRDTVDRYDLDMIAFEMGVTYVEGLRHLVERNRFAGGGGGGDGDGATASPPTLFPPPYPLAFVLGTRRDDPNAGSQGVFAPSSSYMPPFLRCNPIIDWDYGDVWEFLRHPDLRGEVPYCSLYDEGYTSLGTVGDTLPCPALLKEREGKEMTTTKTMGGGGGGAGESYWPAYMLKDWSLERAGRIDKRDVVRPVAGAAASATTTAAATTERDDAVAIERTENDEGEDGEGSGAGTTETAETENETATLTASISTVFLDNDPRSSSRGGGATPDSITTTRDLSARSSLSSMGGRGGRPSSTSSSSPSTARGSRRPSVGLIVIGDEILKGMTPDSNIVTAAKALRSHNVSLARVSVISDDMRDIVNEIRRYANEEEDVDFIVTSGGVGPTHDDVTIKSVAEALGLGMEMNNEMAELLLEKMGSDGRGGGDDIVDVNGNGSEDPNDTLIRRLSVGQRKMATLPTSSVLHYLANNDVDHDDASTSDEWPILQCQNIFMLPGVPPYFEKKMKQLAAFLPVASATIAGESSRDEAIGLSLDRSAHAVGQSSAASPPPRSETYRIVLALPEDTIVAALNAAVAAHPHVTFGSYPIVRMSNEDAYRTIITLEGRFRDSNDKQQSSFFSKAEMDRSVGMALEDLKSSLPQDGILCIDTLDDLRIK